MNSENCGCYEADIFASFTQIYCHNCLFFFFYLKSIQGHKETDLIILETQSQAIYFLVVALKK